MNYARQASSWMFVPDQLRDGWRDYLGTASIVHSVFERNLGDSRGLVETQPNQDTSGLDELYTEVLFESKSREGHYAESQGTGQGTTRDVAPCLAASGRGAERTGESRGQDAVVITGFTSTGRGWWREGKPTETARQWRDAGNGVVAYKKRGGFGISETCDIAGTLESEGGTHQGGPERTPLIAFQPRYYTRDNKPGGQPSETADITNCHKAGDSAPHVVAVDLRNSQETGQVTSTLQSKATGGYSLNYQPCVAFTERTRSDGRNLETQEELAYALTNPGSGGRTHSRQVAGPWGVRRLTPTECRRLQGFPDDWNDWQSDSAAYRQLGNAVCVNEAEWLGRQLLAAMEAQ